jgi:hypothetical protein
LAYPRTTLVILAYSRRFVEVSQLLDIVLPHPLLHNRLDAIYLVALRLQVQRKRFLLHYGEVLELLEHEICTSIWLNLERAHVVDNYLVISAQETVI